MLLSLLVGTALAADGPWLFGREAIGASGWPSGLMSDTVVQLRAPLHRSDSIVFQDTYAGAGAHLMATPAFLDVGPRLSIQPIDFFDVDVQLGAIQYLQSSYGLMPMDKLGDKLDSDRLEHSEDAISRRALSASVSPTLKVQLGPVVAFDSWSLTLLHIDREDSDEDYVYEPYRDLVVAWDDELFDHQSAILYGGRPDRDRYFRIGPAMRNRWALKSTDRSTAIGPMLAARPAASAWSPTLLGQVLWYAEDSDRVGSMPSVGVLAQWRANQFLRR